MQFLLLATGPQGLGKEGGRLRHQLAVLLSGELQVQLEVVAIATYRELVEAIGRGTVGLAWLPPAVFVDAHDRYGVRLLGRTVRHGSTRYRGALYVPADGPRRTFEDLRGASVAWVDPYSCAGHLFPRRALADRGLDPERWLGEMRFAGSHTAAARAVLGGEVDAGAGYVHFDANDDVLDAGWARVAGTDGMRPILVSDLVPNDTICASAHADPELCRAAASALYRLHETPEGPDLLRELFQAVAVEPAREADYASVRETMQRLMLNPDGRRE